VIPLRVLVRAKIAVTQMGGVHRTVYFAMYSGRGFDSTEPLHWRALEQDAR
jgi:hypothetical protein